MLRVPFLQVILWTSVIAAVTGLVFRNGVGLLLVRWLQSAWNGLLDGLRAHTGRTAGRQCSLLPFASMDRSDMNCKVWPGVQWFSKNAVIILCQLTCLCPPSIAKPVYTRLSSVAWPERDGSIAVVEPKSAWTNESARRSSWRG